MEGSLPLLLGGILLGWGLSAGLMWKDRRLGLLVAAVMGLLVSLYLGYQHLASSGASLCSVNQVFDCDKVNRSIYSEVAGIPVALVGSGFYAAVLVASALGLRKPSSYRKAGQLIFLGGLAAIAASLFLAWASVQLGAWCLFCISLYGVNALILTGGSLSRGEATTAAPDDWSLSTMVAAGLLVFIGAMAWYNIQKGGPATEVAKAASKGGTDAYTALMEQAAGPMDLDGTEPILGDPNAPYEVVEYADFQCPGCAAVTPLMVDLVGRNPDIKVLFKNFPLNNGCNPALSRAFHKDSCRAASAGECARQQGKFWDLAHLMFKNQEDLDDPGIMFMAKQAGLDTDQLKTCMADPSTLTAVVADATAGQKINVNGTPSLFLKGIEGDDWLYMTGGPEGIEMLVHAHAAGQPLPPAPPADSHPR